ncbi:MAG: hypothetical protein MJK04_02180 [Psychrosphaera sp.]|nr:hypothetical protein [Psychrosphaera sp.]
MNTKPDFSITANSSDVTRSLTDRVASLEIIQHSGLISDHCILTLDDHRKSRIQAPKPGDTLRIALGYQGDDPLVDHGEYEVAEHSFSGSRDTLTIYANKLMGSARLKSPVQRSWPSSEEKPLLLKTLLADIASNHGLEAKINAQLGEIKLAGVEQSESDLQLMTRLASLYDATARIVEKYLIFMPRGSGLSRSGSKLATVKLDYQQLISWNLLSSQYPAYKSCKASYHDTINAQRKVVTAGSGSPCFELHYPLADEVTAQWAAKSRLNDFKRTTNTLSVTSIGEPNLMAGGVTELSNVRDGIDGQWCLTRVHHRIDASGYISTFDCEQMTV